MNHQHFYYYRAEKHGPRVVEPVATGLDTNLMADHRMAAGFADYSRRNEPYIPENCYCTIGYLDGEPRWWRSDKDGNLLDWCRVECGFSDVIYTMRTDLGSLDGDEYTVDGGKWVRV